MKAAYNAYEITDTVEVQIDGKLEAKSAFRTPTHLEFLRKVGSGAYGRVAAFRDTRTDTQFAVKKITAAFDDLLDGKRILREVKLLRNFDHSNIIRIFDMFPPDSVDFEDIYIVTDLMDTDLHKVIYSKLKLEQDHHRFFAYQILRGLRYLHEANIVHRDLKPANLLVNNNCDLKICDFGLARVIGDETGDPYGNTDYVVTRWYRAPEVVLVASQYYKPIDVWAVGCILVEMMNRRALFPGKDYKDQIRKILSVLGTPSVEEQSWLPPEGEGQRFLRRCPPAEKVSWEEVLPVDASDVSRDAVDAMLRFDPHKRASAQDLMQMPYFKILYDKDDEVHPSPPKVDWSFDDFQPTRALLQKYIYEECASFHPEILKRDQNLLESAGTCD